MAYERSRAAEVMRGARALTSSRTWRAVAHEVLDAGFIRAAPVPVVPVDQLIPHATEICVRQGSSTFGETTLHDLVALAALVARRRPKTAFEFGTFTGVGTLHIALNAPDSIVHTLDLAADHRADAEGLDWESAIDQSSIAIELTDEVRGRVVQHWGDSRRFDTSPLRGAIDFVFIDAGHSYELVDNDTKKALEMAAPGATIVWHDYARACPDVQRVVAELAGRYSPLTVAGTNVAFMDVT